MVDVVESIEQLLHYTFDLAQGKHDVGVAQQAGQIVLTEFKDQVESALESVVWGS